MHDEKRFEQLINWSKQQKAPRANYYAPGTIDITPQPFKLEFQHKIPLSKRIDVVLLMSMLLVFSVLLLGVLGLLIYCFVSAALFK